LKFYGIDTETHDPHLNTKGASWVYGAGEIIVTGLYNAQTKVRKAIDGNGGQTVKKLLLDPKVTLVGAKIVYDLGWLCYEHRLKATDVKCSFIDVAIAEAFIDEYQLHTLDALAWKYLRERKGVEVLRGICILKGLKGDFRKHIKTLWEMGYKKEIREYVISDADQPVRIWQEQKKIVPPESMDALNINQKLIPIVLDMKQRGVRVDMTKRKKNYELLKGIQDRLLNEFTDKYGKTNVNSPKQLAGLFDKLKVPYRCKIRIKGYANKPNFEGPDLWEQRTLLRQRFKGIKIQKEQLVFYVPKQYAERTNDDFIRMGYNTTCNPNIDKDALKAVKKKHAVAKDVVDLKQVTSIIDKFLGPKFDRFIVKYGEDNYRIHADFDITGARQTLRFSSAKPNLQQVPSKTVLFAGTPDAIKLFKLCREIIIPDEGMLWGKADYAGQENRLMAHFAVGEGSAEIRQKYNDNPDFDEHQWVAGTALSLFDIELTRDICKRIKFGLGYGQQIQGLCDTNDWEYEEGKNFYDAYNDTVPFVKTTMDKASETIVKRGYIITLGGRHCHLKKYRGKPNTRSAYKGFNKLIQGSAADMTKKAMVTLYEKGLNKIFPLYLTVHDELDFGIPKTIFAIKQLPRIKEVMENTYQMKVPIRVDPEVGNNWGYVKGRTTKKKRLVDGEEVIIEKTLSVEKFIDKIIREVKAA
jgi:DNA polymerase I-like protein with 3'-5' exonuclease and polymerase domains